MCHLPGRAVHAVHLAYHTGGDPGIKLPEKPDRQSRLDAVVLLARPAPQNKMHSSAKSAILGELAMEPYITWINENWAW